MYERTQLHPSALDRRGIQKTNLIAIATKLHFILRISVRATGTRSLFLEDTCDWYKAWFELRSPNLRVSIRSSIRLTLKGFKTPVLIDAVLCILRTLNT